METRIKTCPFCGGAASLYARYSYKVGGYFVGVQCDICRASGRGYVAKEDPEKSNWNSMACSDAVNAWNMETPREYQ